MQTNPQIQQRREAARERIQSARLPEQRRAVREKMQTNPQIQQRRDAARERIQSAQRAAPVLRKKYSSAH